MHYIENKISGYLDFWHGSGGNNQVRYYRCEGCRNLVTWHSIRKGGCNCGLSPKIRPAVMSFCDKAKCLLVPWSI